jgi:branched-chain amino acid transport system substrate-binding protein
MRRFFILAAVFVTAVAMITLGLPGGATAKDIKVGAAMNLTGPLSSWGQYHAKGLRDYLRYVNEVKGGISGDKIELTMADSAYKVPESVKIVKKFCTAEKMDIITTWDAGSGIMVKPIIQKYKIPDINFSTFPAILKPPVDYAYLPFGDYVMDTIAVSEYIAAIHEGKQAPKVALLTYNNAFGKAIQEPMKKYAMDHNIEIVSIQEFPVTTLDISTELLKIKAAGAEYIFTQLLPGHVVMALQAADRVEYNPIFIGSWTATDPDFFVRAKGLIRDRLFQQFPGGLPIDGTPGVKEMEKVWKRYKSVTKFDTATWEGMSIAMIMEKAFRKARAQFGKIDSKTVNAALETFRNEDFGGALPNITYTKTDHGASWLARMVKVNEDATYTPVTNFWAPGKEPVRIIK